MAPPIPDFSEVFGPSQDELPGLVEGSPALFGIPLVLLDGGMVSLLGLRVLGLSHRPPGFSHPCSLNLASGRLLGVCQCIIAAQMTVPRLIVSQDFAFFVSARLNQAENEPLAHGRRTPCRLQFNSSNSLLS